MLGDKVKQFEYAHLAFNHVPHIVGVDNGFDALVTALRVRDIASVDQAVVANSLGLWFALGGTTHVCIKIL